MEYNYNIYDYLLTRFRKARTTFSILSPIPFIYDRLRQDKESLIQEEVNILSFNACLLTTYI